MKKYIIKVSDSVTDKKMKEFGIDPKRKYVIKDEDGYFGKYGEEDKAFKFRSRKAAEQELENGLVDEEVIEL